MRFRFLCFAQERGYALLRPLQADFGGQAQIVSRRHVGIRGLTQILICAYLPTFPKGRFICASQRSRAEREREVRGRLPRIARAALWNIQ